MVRRLYDWMMDKAAHRHAIWWLAAVSFIESSFFPIPPDVMLIPMVIAAPTRWLRIAMVCTLASVAGGFLGYAIGHFAMDSIGAAILGAFHLQDKFLALKPIIDEWGVWFIIIKGMTPIPYKLVTITAGAFDFDLLKFTLASVVARGMRFLMVAALLWKFGPPIRDFVEKRLTLVTTVFVVLLVGGFLVLKLL
ncbi:cytochrome B [Paramagnetospirillum marisnigri]|uniref:Cytochrome B n=1 Tax=Paramagnetospirillum marisnigri TaxID=1285242 RepID=A0A178MXJ1_9PROT|nr:YqaA family protein [Paramagnetospirillum marisnigri]OAN56002.1 cytochrome B [Paramagnetospirillum marisnigri]